MLGGKVIPDLMFNSVYDVFKALPGWIVWQQSVCIDSLLTTKTIAGNKWIDYDQLCGVSPADLAGRWKNMRCECAWWKNNTSKYLIWFRLSVEYPWLLPNLRHQKKLALNPPQNNQENDNFTIWGSTLSAKRTYHHKFGVKFVFLIMVWISCQNITTNYGVNLFL